MKLTASALVAFAALAAAAPSLAQTAPAPAKAARTLQVCEDSRMARRAFEREHGLMVWVTADQVRAAARAGETWDAPRCIRAAELRRWQAARVTRPVQIATR